MKALQAERKASSGARWSAAMLAEEVSWVAMCKKIRVAASRAHPDDMAEQNEFFETLRQRALSHHWRAPQ